MMLQRLAEFTIPAAYAVLPARMASPSATAMLLAIALQESRCAARRQLRGPARGFWQFELAGLRGVQTHPSSKPHLEAALSALSYLADASIHHFYVAIEHSDVLAAVFARLLLWTDPDELPAADEPDRGWNIYVRCWRPGRPRPESWLANYETAWSLVRAT